MTYSNLRVLSYNTQLRSWGMEFLAQKGLPTHDANKRANSLAQRILNSTHDYDVLCLNEVFDEDARDVLRNTLLGKYPYAVVKADMDTPASYAALTAAAGGLTVAAAGVALELPGSTIGLLLAAGLAAPATLTAKFEDSGLMIFSKFPFVMQQVAGLLSQLDAVASAHPSLAPLLEWLKDLLQSQGLGGSSQVPLVAFVPFKEANVEDGMAAKGALYAGLVLPTGSRLHLVATHTQADGDQAETRATQMQQVWQLVETMVGKPPFSEEVLVCGDLNINAASSSQAEKAEWWQTFDTPGQPFTDHLHDVWHREQCPGRHLPGGGSPSLPKAKDGQPVLSWMPEDCDPGKTILSGRLDYMLRPAQDFPARLTTQHVAIAREVADPNPATQHTSDHYPLRIDLAPRHVRDTPGRADPLSFADDADDTVVAGKLGPGEMQWWVVDRPGGYGFAVTPFPLLSYEIYSADDLSEPMNPFTKTKVSHTFDHEVALELTKYSLPEPPYFIRVFHAGRERGDIVSYELFAHRFRGTSRAEAIPLLRSKQFSEPAREGAPHSLHDPDMPVSTFDSVWYEVCSDPEPCDGGPVRMRAILGHIGDHDALGVEEDKVVESGCPNFGLVVIRAPTGEPPEALIEVVPADHLVDHTFFTRGRERYYILARRDDPTFLTLHYTVSVHTNVTYLYPSPPPTLKCLDETDGFLGAESGNDDMQLELLCDGKPIYTAPNSDGMQFSDGDVRNLLNVPPAGFTRSLTIRLTELDDLSGDDVAEAALKPLAELIPGAEEFPTRNRETHEATHIVLHPDDQDGVYALWIMRSPEPPLEFDC